MADLTTLKTWLAAAELAQHNLLTGSSEEEIEHADMRVKYSRSVTGLQQLGAYIADLKAQIAALELAHPAERRRGLTVDLPGR